MNQSCEALEQREWLHVVLSSIGDAVVTTDSEGNVTLLNPVAQSLTGWTQDQALGQPLATVFRITDEKTRTPGENPVATLLATEQIVGLADHTVLISMCGTERA